jgi:hypothetical protein
MKQHVVRAAIRLAIGCIIPLLVDEYLLDAEDLDGLKSCQWAAVTLVMTSEPLLGQASLLCIHSQHGVAPLHHHLGSPRFVTICDSGK